MKLRVSFSLKKFPDALAAKLRSVKLMDNKLYVDGREVIPEERITNILNIIWANPATGMRGRDSFYDRIKQDYIGISKQDIDDFLKSNPTHMRHRAVRGLKQVTNPIITKRPLECFQVDLAEMPHAYFNGNYKYFMLVCDCFTKFLWLYPLKTKRASVIAKILDNLFTEHRPEILQSDNGSEFMGETKDVCIKHKVKQVFSLPYKPSTNGQIERSVRTIKNMIFRYRTNNNTRIWVNILGDIAANYNSTKHSTTSVRPDQAHLYLEKVAQGIKAQATKWTNDLPENNIKEGDFVRITNLAYVKERRSNLTKKKYLPNYYPDIHEVVASRGQNVYLKGDNNIYKPKQLLVVNSEQIEPEKFKIGTSFYNREIHNKTKLNAPYVARVQVSVDKPVTNPPVVEETPYMNTTEMRKKKVVKLRRKKVV